MGLGVSESDDREGVDRREVMLLWHERLRRGAQAGQKRTAPIGQAFDVLAGKAKDVAALLGRVQEHAEMDKRTNWRQVELKRRNDAEVPAATPKRPEQVFIFAGRRLQHAAVSGDDLGGEEVVRCEPSKPAQPAKAAAER